MNTASNTYTSYNGINFELQWNIEGIASTLAGILNNDSVFREFSGIDFLHVSAQFLAIKFSDMQAAHEYQASLQNKFTQKSKSWNSEPNSDGTQNLKYAGRCEYNRKYYVLAQTCNQLDEDNLNEERGIWKGVVLNPELYFSDEAQKQVDEGAQRTGEILGKGNNS